MDAEVIRYNKDIMAEWQAQLNSRKQRGILAIGLAADGNATICLGFGIHPSEAKAALTSALAQINNAKPRAVVIDKDRKN